MQKLIYILLSLFFIFSSCDKGDESTPPGTTPGGGTEQPGNGNGNEPGGNKPDPEYDPETQVLIAGIVWDKKNALDYCTFDEAEAAAKSAKKTIPTESDWNTLLKTGYTWDKELDGYWYGEDSSKLSESEKSIFLPALGYKMDSGLNVVKDKGIGGEFWCFADRGFSGFSASFVRNNLPINFKRRHKK